MLWNVIFGCGAAQGGKSKFLVRPSELCAKNFFHPILLSQPFWKINEKCFKVINIAIIANVSNKIDLEIRLINLKGKEFVLAGRC